MISYTEQKKQWYNHFKSLQLDGQYEMFMELLEQNIPDGELINDDFGSVSVDLKSELINDKQYEKAIKLIEKVKESTTKFYQKEFPYLSNFAVEYYLYTKDFEKMHDHLEPFIANPGHGYDLFLPLYDKVRFYQMNELAVNLASELHEPVMESDELIGGAETELMDMIFYNMFQELYKSLERNGSIPDFQQLKDDLKKYDYDDTFFAKELPKAYQAITTIAASNGAPVFTSSEWAKAAQENPTNAIRTLYWSFAVYMLKQGNFNFSISADIWFSYCATLSRENSLSDFKLKYKVLDKLIGGYFNFISNKEEKGFAVLWGIPFIYDFLQDQHMVTEETKDEALEHVATIKKALLKIHKDDIWRFDFVHKWVKPLSVSDESFVEEEKYFHQTFLNRDRNKPIPSKAMPNNKQLSLFDDLLSVGKNKQQTKSIQSNEAKKKKRMQAKKQRNKNRKK